MRLIDNVNTRLGDDLKASIAPGSHLRIAAATFSLYAFEALRSELEQIDHLDFLFTTPSFIAPDDGDSSRRERRHFFIPRLTAEAQLAGSEFEVRLRNRLTQRAIAKECADWIRRKAQFRSTTTHAPMQQFLTVNNEVSYFPIGGFTAADLGYERTDAISAFTQVCEAPETPHTNTFIAQFMSIWTNTSQVAEVTEAVASQIEAIFAENSPARVYFLILYNIFADFLDEITDDVLPNEGVGFRETAIWQALYNFQRDAATGIINKLETYNGCILADSVGLGKTYTALAVIKYYELRNKSVLVLAPKKLSDNWTTYNSPYVTNPFTTDRFGYKVLAHTDLSRAKGESLGTDLRLLNWSAFDLVVIDESHNFRNASERTDGRETRYQRLMNQVVRKGVRTKVLMLSATPVNNRFNDLKNQVALAYEGDSDRLASRLPITATIDQVFREAQRVFNEWSELPPAERTTDAILKRLDFDFFTVLDAVTIARSRKHIQAYYDTSAIGAFPERLRPESLRPGLTDLPGVPGFDELFAHLTSLNLGVYAPLSYVHASQIAKYDELLGGGEGQNRTGGSLGNLGHAGRERGIQKLMTINLLKRLESSVEAFRLTLQKVNSLITASIDTIDSHGTAIQDVSTSFSNLDEGDDDFDVAPATVGKMSIELDDMDTVSWRRDLAHDHSVINGLLEAIAPITPDHDLKLQALRERLRTKVSHPLNEGNRKALIFSAFADTANYLYNNLVRPAQAMGVHLAVVTGSGAPRTTVGTGLDFQHVLTLFSPRSKSRNVVFPRDARNIDVLIGTDCISEGQNLQDCDTVINYDIHWNPVRIIQRFGRIDRIGSKNALIQMVNFWPNISLDEYLNLKERVENRMIIADITATADDNPLTQASAETEFRREQLRRLQDEVIELEDVRTGVSITDLGLNEFRMDLLEHIREHGDLSTAPKGMHAVIPARPDKGLVPGVIFALRSISLDSTAGGEDINRGNRLHPYYLVYLSDDGQVVADHTEAKRLLDLVRAGCRSYDEPVGHVTALFNAATADGSDMHKYSALLTRGIEQMIDVSEEKDIDSLFSPGPTTALRQTIAGLDDFELLAFVAVVEPPGLSDEPASAAFLGG